MRTLREAGHKVIASDILHHDFPLDFEGDFLDQVRAPTGTELILTNPPFKDATEFVDHALELCPRGIMFARLAFLESERRSRILDAGALAGVHAAGRWEWYHVLKRRGAFGGLIAGSAAPGSLP